MPTRSEQLLVELTNRLGSMDTRVGSLEVMFKGFMEDAKAQREFQRDEDKERDEKIEKLRNRSLFSWPVTTSILGLLFLVGGSISSVAYTFHRQAVTTLEGQISEIRSKGDSQTAEIKDLKKDNETCKSDIALLEQSRSGFDSALRGVYSDLNGAIGHILTLVDIIRVETGKEPFPDHQPFAVKRE